MAEKTKLEEDLTIWAPKDYQTKFDPGAYLTHFYGKSAVDDGLKLLLFTLPNFAHRIGSSNCRILDIGSGPTVYVALCLRNIATSIYLSDYLDKNRDTLITWWKGSDPDRFDWEPVCRSIAITEGNCDNWTNIENIAREKLGGVWNCDVHQPEVILDPQVDPTEQFDVVTCIFCLESACQNHDQYKKAMKHVVNRVKPGGFFILGSVIEDDVYHFGHGCKFSLLYLTETDIGEAMAEAGLDTSDLRYCVHEGAYVVMAQKPFLNTIS